MTFFFAGLKGFQGIHANVQTYCINPNGTFLIIYLQATLAPPVKGKMFKGLSVCYSVVTLTFFTVGISGYWAFGNEAESLILSNFSDNGKALLPKWFIFMTNTFTILQLSAVAVVKTKHYLTFSTFSLSNQNPNI